MFKPLSILEYDLFITCHTLYYQFNNINSLALLIYKFWDHAIDVYRVAIAIVRVEPM